MCVCVCVCLQVSLREIMRYASSSEAQSSALTLIVCGTAVARRGVGVSACSQPLPSAVPIWPDARCGSHRRSTGEHGIVFAGVVGERRLRPPRSGV